MTGDAWILAVRKCVTDHFTKITVEEVMVIFAASSLQMTILHNAYLAGDTPAQAFEKVKGYIDPIYK